MALELVHSNEPEPRSLRRELQDSIANHAAAEGRARIARDTLARAEGRLKEAIDAARRAKDALDHSARASTQAAAQDMLAALRAGRELPDAIAPAQESSPALAQAISLRNSLQIAVLALEAELREANDAAARALGAVQTLADAIQGVEGHQLAGEFIALQELSWRLEDRLRAVFDLDAKRERPRLSDLHKRVNARGHRRNRAEAADPQLIEQWKWQHFLDEAMRIEARRWQDYHNRLCENAAATLEGDR